MKKVILSMLVVISVNVFPAFAYQDISCSGKINNEAIQVYLNDSSNTLTLDGHDFKISARDSRAIASQTYHNDKGQSFYAVLSTYQYNNQAHHVFALMNGELDKLNEIIFYVDLQCQKLKRYT